MNIRNISILAKIIAKWAGCQTYFQKNDGRINISDYVAIKIFEIYMLPLIILVTVKKPAQRIWFLITNQFS